MNQIVCGIFIMSCITFCNSPEGKSNYLPTDYSHLTDSIFLNEIKLNGAVFPTTTDEVITLLGKPDRKVEFESDIDPGEYTLSLNYGSTSFEECKKRRRKLLALVF